MSARGGKAFRPGKFLRPQNYDDDDASDDDSDDDVEEEEDVVQQNNKGGGGAAGSSDSEEEDDDDEEEEEENTHRPKRKNPSSSSGGGGGGSKTKRPKASSFFDMEAEASDDDDEEDDIPYGTHYDPHDVVKKHYTEEDIRREQMDDEAKELMRQQDLRRRGAGGIFGQMGEVDAADIAKDIENRHRMINTKVNRNAFDQRDETGGPEGVSTVVQQSLVPSVSDPSLWMVSCATGKEQELVFQIMNKCVAFARKGKPLGISAAIAAQSKGKIFIESYGEPAVKEAIDGVHGLMQYTMRLVPIQDMTTVMTVTSKKKMVKVNEWVRMTRGHYKGDLALIRAVRDGGLKCVVQCVPRLDLTLSDMTPEQRRIRNRTVRPPQKFFNPQEVKAMGKQTLRRQRFPGSGMDQIYCDYFEGNYYLDGYLLKEMTVGSMVKPLTDEDPPTLDELQSFRQRKKKGADDDDDDVEENAGSKMAASLLDELSDLQGRTNVKSGASGGGLLIGDTVEVIEGDLVGMQGKLVSLDESTVKVKPNNADGLNITGEIEFLASQVRKYIAVGAHVKITEGRYANETGTVVNVEKLEGENDFTAVILTDTTSKEITVRTSQLRESVERNTGQDRLQGYELYDLVVLSGGGSANEVGVIVRVGREDFTVVNNHGIVREVRPEELRGKQNSRSMRAVALDVQGNQIRVGDTVNVAEGPHKGKGATIKRMSRSQLFLHSQTRSEHAGIFVVRSRSCVLAGSRSQRSGGGAGSGGMASPFSTPQSQNSGRGPPGGGGRNQKGRDDGLIGKTVRIQAGQWKGYLGSVCEATATHVKVELHSRLKKVMVVRERVAVVGDKYGATEDQNRSAPPTNVMAPTTPFVGSSAGVGGATPMHGGATPMHGGATPMHDSMDGDEVWRPGGAIDRDGSDAKTNGNSNDDGWGSTNDTSNADDGWGSSSGNAGDGWGTENNNPNTTAQQQSSDSSTNHNQTNSSSNNNSANGQATELDNDGLAGGGNDAGDETTTAVWFMERVCVQLNSNGAQAVIREVNNGDNTAVVELVSGGGGSTQTVRVGDVSMVPPKEHDMVLVTGGADVGVEGELVCIDGSDAILKDSNEDFKIVDFVCLAKIVVNSDG